MNKLLIIWTIAALLALTTLVGCGDQIPMSASVQEYACTVNNHSCVCYNENNVQYVAECQ